MDQFLGSRSILDRPPHTDHILQANLKDDGPIDVLDEIAARDVSVLRTWAFQDLIECGDSGEEPLVCWFAYSCKPRELNRLPQICGLTIRRPRR